jgi:nucleoside-diphosphate-sugar epimerase
VYAASSSAYGNTAELPKHEGMTPRPLSPYAVSKLAGEAYCRAFYSSFGVETIALRYFNIFGPRQDPASQYAAVIPKFITAALSGDEATIFGDGNQTRDFTYVSNAVRANILACEAPSAACGEVYNIGCGERLTVNSLWSRIIEISSSTSRVRHELARTGDVRDSLASLKRSREMLGYEPLVTVDDGLAETVRSFAVRSAV